MSGLHPNRVIVTLTAAVALAGSDMKQAWSQTPSGLPLPPGNVVSGQVFKPPFECAPSSVPSITNGADANAYILPSSCSAQPSFVANAPAAMVVTAAPTEYVRFYCPTCSTPSVANRPFMADTSTVRGLTPTQIQNVLALPAVPTMETIVLVPAGSCMLVGKGAPAFGGSGGAAQEWAAGTPSGANCFGLQYLPASDYVNQQPIGAAALLYGPNAGGGNAGAVAAALDRGPYPAPFTGMTGIYNSLDLLNFGNPAPLQAALVQLDGEIHASAQTVMLGDSLYLREAVLGRLRQSSFMGSAGPMAALGSGGPALAYVGDAGSSDFVEFSPLLRRRACRRLPDQGSAAEPAGQRNRVLGLGDRCLGPVGRQRQRRRCEPQSRRLLRRCRSPPRAQLDRGGGRRLHQRVGQYQRPGERGSDQYRASGRICRSQLRSLEPARRRRGELQHARDQPKHRLSRLFQLRQRQL